jgi:N-acetylmuramoyl-L-alanine amidase
MEESVESKAVAVQAFAVKSVAVFVVKNVAVKVFAVKNQVPSTLIRRVSSFFIGAFILTALIPLLSGKGYASAHIHHNEAWARQQFVKAERMREALNGRPLGQRTRAEYQRVIDAYRRVYMGSPSSSRADSSVLATAELMVEMGRRFDDNKILLHAIDQYRFLRKEYPGSKYRCDALFTIGEIYKDDLNDAEEARAAFEDFLNRYPHNRLYENARAAVKEIDSEAAERERGSQKSAKKQRGPSGSIPTNGSVRNDAGRNTTARNDRGTPTTDASISENTNSADATTLERNALPRVTGVRHWSTPDYTRVAIDVEQEVKFASQRISNPDRIFFDLRDTKLASTLVGKTFDVDDGFLKKIRVAEFQPGRTRIVLEVDNLARYDAFLLPDPYRLIIDVHGKQKRTMGGNGEMARAEDRAAETNPAERDDSGYADASTDDTSNQPGSLKSNARPDKYGIVETDLPPANNAPNARKTVSGGVDRTDSPRSTKNSNGVVKTTTTVKGTNRTIPKTIVTNDDDDDPEASVDEHTDDATVAAAKTKAKRGARSTLANEDTGARTDADEDATTGSGSPSAAGKSSPATSRNQAARQSGARAKPHSAAGSNSNAGDTGDLVADSREALPTAAGGRSLTRALGLKIGKIVIDAGHGGHDTGTIGPNGLLEKDLVLDVAKRLGRLLETRLGAEVIYTRRDDTFVPLETRTAIANRERADLFISVHANSSHDPDARGVETYYLNFTSSPEALEVAARENAVSEKSVFELQDLVKKIALKEKIDESREFAGDVQESLFGGLSLSNSGIRNRGVKKAPFIVLIGANMPSILAEISFVSNPSDERKLETAEYRQRIAESLYRGVAKYANGLSGVKVASKIDKPEGQ